MERKKKMLQEIANQFENALEEQNFETCKMIIDAILARINKIEKVLDSDIAWETYVHSGGYRADKMYKLRRSLFAKIDTYYDIAALVDEIRCNYKKID